MFRTARLTVAAALLSAVALGGFGASSAVADDDDHKRGHREHHDREHHDREHHHRDHDHHGHGHHDHHRHHGHDRHHDHHGHHHHSHRKACGHIGACPTRTVRICVRAGHYDSQYVPAVTQTCYDSHGHAYTKVICAAHWKRVWVPPVYETRHVSICETRHSSWSFSFGF